MALVSSHANRLRYGAHRALVHLGLVGSIAIIGTILFGLA